jgi:hypothetical protein
MRKDRGWRQCLRGWPLRRQNGEEALEFAERHENLRSGLESLEVAALDGAVDALHRQAEHAGRFQAGEDKRRAIRVSPWDSLSGWERAGGRFEPKILASTAVLGPAL